MRHLLMAAALVLFNGLAGVAAAQAAEVKAKVADEAPPEGVSRFLMGTRLGYITCSNHYRTYLEKRELYTLVNPNQTASTAPPSDEASAACVHETLLKGRSLYGDASKHATSPAAKAALRDYYTAWEQSLQSLRQPAPEQVRAYRERQQRTVSQLDTLQEKLERAR
jgi:hypothetical protein